MVINIENNCAKVTACMATGKWYYFKCVLWLYNAITIVLGLKKTQNFCPKFGHTTALRVVIQSTDARTHKCATRAHVDNS